MLSHVAEIAFHEQDMATAEPVRPASHLPLVLAIAAVALWLAGMAWLLLPTLGEDIAPADLVQLIAALCVPPALVGILWLLSQRNSVVESDRLARTARTMRSEVESLESRIAILNDMIDANRQSLADQSTILLDASETAAERMHGVSNQMVREVASLNGAARMLDESSDLAGKRLSVLLSSLPRAHGETVDMAATLERLGMTAGETVSALDSQLSALAERGRIADEVSGGAAQRLAAHIARMEATSESAGARLDIVASNMSAAVDAVLDRAAQAIDESRKGIAAQGDAMLAMLESNQASLDRAGREGMEQLSDRLAMVERSIAQIADALDRERGNAERLFETLDTNVLNAAQRIETLHGEGSQRAASLADTIAVVTAGLEGMGEAMRASDQSGQATIATAEGLLVALDAAVREIDETLPQALVRLDSRVADSRSIVGAAKPELLALVTAAESTHDAIEAINATVTAQRDTLVTLSAALVEALGTGSERIDGIQTAIQATITDTRDFADNAAPRLVEALVRIRETANTAADNARASLATVIPDAATRLEAASVQALARAIDGAVTQQLGALSEATEDAVRAANRASDRVSQQLLTIADATAQIDNRIEHAQTEIENAERDSFARRMSLLIEALNSASIDIDKALSTEVSDSAWAAYLKGDRGVFTRRAVRLIEPGQLRDIAALYDQDDFFRDLVNRYIHDFESMLRQVLAHRDGSPMGITLLSSDSGKLYVALAQAIERLRT